MYLTILPVSENTGPTESIDKVVNKWGSKKDLEARLQDLIWNTVSEMPWMYGVKPHSIYPMFRLRFEIVTRSPPPPRIHVKNILAWENNLSGLVEKCVLSYGAEPFLGSCQLCSYSRTSQHFMYLDGSSPCSQEPSTGPYPKPDRSSPYHPILFSKIYFNIVDQSTSWSS
jgi:hypothetical protein